MELQDRCRGLRYGGSRPRRDASRNRSTRRRSPARSDFTGAREPAGLPALQASRVAWEDSGGKAAGNGQSCAAHHWPFAGGTMT